MSDGAKILCLGCLAVLLLLAPWPGIGQGAEAPAPITNEILARAFPGADAFGAFEGQPPAAPAFRQGRVAGYVFSTESVAGSVGFSGKPLDVLAGLGLDGRITGAYLYRHSEPILIIGIASERLHDFVANLAGIDLNPRAIEKAPKTAAKPDSIAGATISASVIRHAVLRSARAIGRARGILKTSGSARRLDRETRAEASWPGLVADGSISKLLVTTAMAERALTGKPPSDASAGEAPFIDLYLGLLSPPRVGENLLGRLDFNDLSAAMGAAGHAIVVAANGLYSFKGTAHVRSGRFERIQLVQGRRTIRLTRAGYRNVERLRLAGAPVFREIGVFMIAGDTGFDPLAPWRLELMVNRELPSGGLLSTSFALPYALPARYVIAPPPGAPPEETTPMGASELWLEIWTQRTGDIAIVAALLLLLSGVLVFQDVLSRNPALYRNFRRGFLAVVALWLGWAAGGQLSVINVITFSHSLLGDFHWEFFLLDPVIFLLWSYVAMTLLFWGRGVFCGWLCPFGALQELLNEAARALHIPQIAVPFPLHERLWAIKYIIFLGLFAISLHATDLAVMGAEVEPFKTVFSLVFARSWPFIAFALALLTAGLFIERFFCRYLCPLGAALAIPARLHMFDWLKRRFQCGHDCTICAQRCTVQAIHPDGRINPNECIHCLACQTYYFDVTACPPLIAQAKRRERRRQLARPATMTEAAADD